MGRDLILYIYIVKQLFLEYSNVTKSTYPDGTKEIYSYDARDRVTKQADANGNETYYTYDGADRLISVEDALGNKYSYDYDQNGSLIKVTDPLGHETKYTYDSMGRVVGIENALGKKATNTYDESGKLVEATTFAGNKTAVRYPNGTVMSYTYDACNRLKEEALTNASGKLLTKYSYTLGKAGERLSIAEEDVSGNIINTSYKYDALNRLVSEEIKDANGSIVNEYTYDSVSNRTSKKTTVTGDIKKIADTKDENCQIIAGETTYEYSAFNQLLLERTPAGDISYTYDGDGNLVKCCLPH